jgi:hypothetical protein
MNLLSLMMTAIAVGGEDAFREHNPGREYRRDPDPVLVVDPGPHFDFRPPMSADRDRHYYALVCPPMNRRTCKPCDRSSMGRCKEHRKQDARARAAKAG